MAAIAAGLKLVQEPVSVVLGVDFPFVDQACVDRILADLTEQDGVILRDDTGRHQFLVGAYKTEALRTALSGREPHGMSVKDLIGDFDLLTLDDPRSTRDCDTWEDVYSVEAAFSTEAV
ncbi:MAG: hypothetical protein QOG04_1644 [Actinomycetota bacterium]|nr:hypothetical protein [Actinomycetota bacterium]